MSRLISWLFLSYSIFIVVSCGGIIHIDDVTVKFDYVSKDGETQIYYQETVDANDGINDYVWADTCNSIKISLKDTKTEESAYDKYKFKVDFDTQDDNEPISFIDHDIVHLYTETGTYTALFTLYNKETGTETEKYFEVRVTERALCDNIPITEVEQLSIIRFNPTATDEQKETVFQKLADSNIPIVYTYTHIFPGFAIAENADNLEVLQTISTYEGIEQISINQVLEKIEQDTFNITNGLHPLHHYEQQESSSGLEGENNVHLYILDTAMYRHNEFNERIREGRSFVVEGDKQSNGVPYFGDDNAQDYCHDHATHVTGIAAGKDYGVANQALIHPVRVLNCHNISSVARVLAALDWITENAEKPAIVNMSIGARASRHLDDAVRHSSELGIFYVVSAGNQGNSITNSCNQSPARVSSVMTVSASDHSRKVLDMSLQGACVDMFALGGNVPSAGTSSPNAITAKSGTSMAVPQVVGAATHYLQKHPEAKPKEVHDYLINISLQDVLDNVADDTVNRLLAPVPDLIDTVKPILSNIASTTHSGKIIVTGNVTDGHSGVQKIETYDGPIQHENATISFGDNKEHVGTFTFHWTSPMETSELTLVAFDKANNILEVSILIP